jgi:hypothetical protein
MIRKDRKKEEGERRKRTVGGLLDRRDEEVGANDHKKLRPRRRLALEDALEDGEEGVSERRGNEEAVETKLQGFVVLLEEVEREESSALLCAERRCGRASDVTSDDFGEDAEAAGEAEVSGKKQTTGKGTYLRDPDVTDLVSIGRRAKFWR